MIRSLLACSAVFAAGCASAPQTPEQLIVGDWTCSMEELGPDFIVSVDFEPDGGLRVGFDGTLTRDGVGIDAKLDVTGAYALQGAQLTGSFESVKVHRLMIDGEVTAPELVAAMEESLLAAGGSVAVSTVDTLDLERLILDSSQSISCTRQSF